MFAVATLQNLEFGASVFPSRAVSNGTHKLIVNFNAFGVIDQTLGGVPCASEAAKVGPSTAERGALGCGLAYERGRLAAGGVGTANGPALESRHCRAPPKGFIVKGAMRYRDIVRWRGSNPPSEKPHSSG